jgi:hypothetical protein
MMVEYYEDNLGKVHMIVDMKVFRIYHPDLFLRPISYNEYEKRKIEKIANDAFNKNKSTQQEAEEAEKKSRIYVRD